MSASTERAVTFECEGEILLGVLHEPTVPTDVGVVVVVGGPQYRAGSHRQFVQLARALATAGVAVLRFDVRGMGDSSGVQRNFEGIAGDIGAAVDTLHAQVSAVQSVVLWGLCDGAAAALLYLSSTSDARIQGLVLVNPWVRSEVSLARTRVRYYYGKRFAEREFWVKLLSGRVSTDAWRGLLSNLCTQFKSPRDLGMPFQLRMADAWIKFKGGIFLVLSGNDLTAKEFLDMTSADPSWAAALRHPRLVQLRLPEADHTFSTWAWKHQVNGATAEWVKTLCKSIGLGVVEAS